METWAQHILGCPGVVWSACVVFLVRLRHNITRTWLDILGVRPTLTYWYASTEHGFVFLQQQKSI